jgi:AraC family L-rhamnose operon transcriptional activator RhaR
VAHLLLFLGQLARTVAEQRDRRGTEPAHPAVRRVRSALEGDLTRQWTLPDLAGQVGLTTAYLVRVFKSATGQSPLAYLGRLRVETAAEMLLHSDESVTAIAQAIGWPDQSYFARRFKRYYGLTATAYRSRFRTRPRSGVTYPR